MFHTNKILALVPLICITIYITSIIIQPLDRIGKYTLTVARRTQFVTFCFNFEEFSNDIPSVSSSSIINSSQAWAWLFRLTELVYFS